MSASVVNHVAVLAEISLRSNQNLFIFTIKQYIDRIKISKTLHIFFEKAALVVKCVEHRLGVLQRNNQMQKQSKQWLFLSRNVV